ncbi:MAG: 3-phosphoshikimate 1-carboxyvinyltransferase [Candidatus Sericytochromatia bacterium]
MNYLVKSTNKNINLDINLTSSKSESNRLLIIKALSNDKVKINNLSDSEDTKTLINLLDSIKDSNIKILDAGPAGTTFRFLVSYLSIQNGITKTLTGSERMKERPIKYLVNALKELGADINYLEKEGYPPLEITGKNIEENEISISGSISSQYISSLMLIAPILKNGLKINIKDKISSKPYIDMTLKILNYFGINAYWQNKSIIIDKGVYEPKTYTIEGDWSSASYLYEILSFSDSGEINIKGLRKDSLQGDSVISEIMKSFGIETIFNNNSINIKKSYTHLDYFEYDFSNCPDIAQTIAVICAGLGVNAKLSGLESLKVKETNRVQALVNELTKLGIDIYESSSNVLEIKSGKVKSDIFINTYKDHRMAMAFAPLSIISKSIIIEDPSVVSKSYPNFWNDLSSVLNFIEQN